MDLDKLRRGLLQKIHNTAQTFRQNTLDKTDLDERIVSGVQNTAQRFARPSQQRQRIKLQDNFVSQLGRSRVGQGITNFQRGIENRTLPKVNLTDPTKSNYFSLGSVRLPNTVQSPIPMPVLNTGFQALGKVQNTQAPAPRFFADVGFGMAQDMVNLPQRLLEGGGRIGVDIVRPLQEGRQINPMRATGALASTALPLLDIATLGGGRLVTGVGKQALKQGANQSLKRSIAIGTGKGMGLGAGYGGLAGMAEGDQTTLGNTAMGIGGGLVFGGTLGAGASGIGAFSALVKRTPQVEKQLRDKMGRYTKGDTPIKPPGMPKSQWDFQLQFNSKYNRNPYTPVYSDDLKRAVAFETEKRGAGLSIRDVNKDKNPLGVANAGLYDMTKLKKVPGTKRTYAYFDDKGEKVGEIAYGGGIANYKGERGYVIDIAKVRSTKPGTGTGSRVIESLKQKADNEGARLVVDWVEPGSETYWKKMGFEFFPTESKGSGYAGYAIYRGGSTHGIPHQADNSLNRGVTGTTGSLPVVAKSSDAPSLPANRTIHNDIISSQSKNPRVAQPSKVDTELPEGVMGFANISSEGTKMRSGKIKVRNFPTQTEVKNRAELNAGNPDLYTQRGQKIKTILGQEDMGGNVQTVQSRQRKSDILPSSSDTISSPVSPRGQTSGKIPYRSSNGKIPSNTDPVNVTGIEKPSRFTKFREVVQDEWIRVKNLQRQKGVKVDETSNPYLMEELYHGRVGARLEDVKSTVSTIDKDIVKTAKNLKTEDAKLTQMVNEYLHAKHTPERNARLGDGAAGMTNAEAQKILKDIDASPLGKEVKRIASQVKELNQKTLDILYDGEVIDKELYDTLRATYKDHVPLNRIMDETGEIADILAGKGFNVKGTGVKRAKGSDREVADIFTNVTANVEQAIVRAERNRVNKATLNFARQNPQLGIFEEIRPKAIGESFDGKPLLKQITDPNVLHVRENGKPVYLKIKDDRLAQVFQGVGQEKLPSLFNFVSTFTRFYSGLHTRFNPEFAVSNIVRDTQELAVYMASQKNVGLRGSVKTVTKDPKSIKAITDFLRGVDSPDTRLYKQMQMDGGTTGGMALSTREKVELDIEQIRRLNRSNPKQAMEKLLQGFDKWNTIFEDSSRLSAYKQALESGYSRDQAASIAKNSTVNFNKKGSGGAIINSLYMFSNASIQGSTKMLRAMKDPKVAGAVLTTVGGSTFAVNSWNDSVDPDWRDKVTEWDRTSNLVVMIPSTEGAKYFTIPVSWGIKPIKVASDTIYDLATGKTDNVGDAAFKILKSGIDAYNPTGGTDAISMLSPTVMDLPVDLARNKSWTGAKIKPDWMEGLPQAEQRFSNTDQTLTGKIATQATKALSEKTNRVLDFNPEQLLYAYDNLIGGVGRFGSKTLNLVTSISQGSLPPAKDVPFGSRFYKTRTEEQIQQGLGYKSENEFFDKLKQFETGSEMQKEEIRNYLRTLPDDDARKNTLFKIRDQGFDTKGISYSAEKLGPSTISDTTPTERVFEESPEAPQNVMERVRMAAQGMTKDPGNVIKAIFTEERMRKIENDAVILERELYLNNLNDKNLHVDHVIPLGLGGDNSDGNLQVMTVDEKAKKDKLEKQLIYQLQTGQIDRVSAQAQIRAFNMENPVGVPYDRMSKTKQKALEDKVVEITDVEDENGYPTMPKLTGNKELDKKLMSKFKGEITKKKNEIVKAYEAGEMTAEEAEAELMKLNSIESSSKAKSGKGRAKKLKIKFVKPKYVEGKVRASSNSVLDNESAGIPNFTIPQISTPDMQVPNIRVGTPSKPVFNVKFNL